MQVSQINSTNFGSKQKVLDSIDYSNFQQIKKKIGNGSVLHTDDMFWHNQIGYLRIDDVFFSNILPARVKLGKSELEINDDGSYKILKKPLFQSKTGLMNKLGKYLAFFVDFYELPNIVEKKYISETGYIDESDGKAYITERKWL